MKENPCSSSSSPRYFLCSRLARVGNELSEDELCVVEKLLGFECAMREFVTVDVGMSELLWPLAKSIIAGSSVDDCPTANAVSTVRSGEYEILRWGSSSSVSSISGTDCEPLLCSLSPWPVEDFACRMASSGKPGSRFSSIETSLHGWWSNLRSSRLSNSFVSSSRKWSRPSVVSTALSKMSHQDTLSHVAL